MKTINELCDLVRETSYAIHLYHGHGHLEKVYENALVHRLQKQGVEMKQQYPIAVLDEDGTLIGNYNADLIVDNRLVVEIKAAKCLADDHTAQLLGYLKSTRIEHGLMINFGSYKFQIKKYALSQTTPSLPGSSVISSAFNLSALFAFSCGYLRLVAAALRCVLFRLIRLV